MTLTRRRQMLTLAASAALASALLLTGCGSSGAPSATSAASPTVDASFDGAATLRVGSVFPSSTLDPSQLRSNADLAYLAPIYDRLLQMDADLNIVPMLAENFEWSEDRRSMTLSLRTDVQFHDGSNFDSSVVKANIEAKKAGGSPAVLAAVSAIESVETPDTHTVVLHLAEGSGADLPLMLAEAAGFMVSPLGLTSGTLETTPAGSGPYRVEEVKAGASITYAKTDTYWDDEQDERPAVIIASTFTDGTTLLNAFEAGDLDVVLTDDNARVRDLMNQPDVRSKVAEQFGSYKIQFNHASPKIQDIRVRQAIAHSVDRMALSIGAFDGTCEPTAQLAVKSSPLYDPALEDQYPFDIDSAKELLDAAGYADGLELNGLMVAASPFDKVSAVLQGMLDASGIDVTYRSTTIAASTADWADGASDFVVYGGGMMINSQIGIESVARNVAHPTIPFGTTDMVQEAAAGFTDSALTETEHDAVMAAANEAIVTDVGSVILCSFNRIVLANDDVIGYDDIPNVYRGGSDFANMRIAKD